MAAYPPPSDLDAWIAPRYLDDFRAGALRAGHLSRHPFPHAALPDFFRPDIFERIRADCLVEETSAFDKGGEPMHQGFLRVPELVRLLYGPDFRRFLGALTGTTLVRPSGGDVEATALAQVRHYASGSTGLRIHTDDDVGFDLTMLLYLSAGWRPELGGETSLFRRIGGLLVEEKVIEPRGNTLVLFFLSGDSWHCVREQRGDWRRSNLFLGWRTTPPLDPPAEIALGGRSTASTAG